MSILLLRDADRVPGAFRWNGPIRTEDIDQWVENTGFVVPPELLEVWSQVGGGELFESETLFQPMPGHEDDIDAANEELLTLGLPFGLLVFHRGRCVSAVDEARGDIVELAVRTFTESRHYRSFDEWYRLALRDEYAQRYGLGEGG